MIAWHTGMEQSKSRRLYRTNACVLSGWQNLESDWMTFLFITVMFHSQLSLLAAAQGFMTTDVSRDISPHVTIVASRDSLQGLIKLLPKPVKGEKAKCQPRKAFGPVLCSPFSGNVIQFIQVANSISMSYVHGQSLYCFAPFFCRSYGRLCHSCFFVFVQS